MSEEPTQPTTAEAEARAAEQAENVALTDARRAEEEVARAQAEKEAAAKEEEKLSRKEQKLREKAERVGAEADRLRAQADAAAAPYVPPRTGPDTHATPTDGAAPFPGSDKLPDAAQRPEVLIGATFAGAFIVARILKRIFD